ARPRPRRRRDAPDSRSAHSPGAAGWREHAGLRQESESRRGQRARRVHGNVAAVSAWPVEPSVAIPAALTAVVYLRGWNRLRRTLPRRIRGSYAVIFLASLATLLLALSSPVERLAEQWLSAHMVQHMLLMVVVAPLFWMGAPVAPLLVGLP